MKSNRRVNAASCLLIMLAVALGIPRVSAGADLDQILKQMEAIGKRFRSFKAHFAEKKYTAVLKEFDDYPLSGEFYYERASDGSALLRQEITKPAVNILTIKGGIAKIYQPSLKQAQLYSLGKNKDKAEYLALGLGQSPAKLQQTFDLKAEGTEAVDGVPCSVLLLRPKDASAAAYFSSITLWITVSSGIPIQMKLQEPNGDYLLRSFSGEKLNAKISASMFEQKLPAGVEIQTIH